jgi:hypothetical protein
VQLRQGNFAEGWKGFEWRRRQAAWEPRKLPGPEWDGRPAPGRRLLLYCEQGLGDTIQFARFAQTAAAMGLDVTLEVQTTLARLMPSLESVRVIGKGTPLPAFDCHLPLMSIPHVLGLTSVTPQAAYLSVEAERVAHWSRQLPREGFRVGVAWQGNPRAPGDRGRSIPLREYRPLSRVPGVSLISLQKNDGVEQLKRLPPGMALKTFGSDRATGADAFLDTAAVMMNLDLIITSDTSVAHLAGALGRPLWVALKHVPCWRWLSHGEQSQWYSTARLFRQARRDHWEPVFAQIAEELTQLVAEARRT